MRDFISLDPDKSIDPLSEQLRRGGSSAPESVADLLRAGLAALQGTTHHDSVLAAVLDQLERSATAGRDEDTTLLVATLAAFEVLDAQPSCDAGRVTQARHGLIEHLVGRDLTRAFADASRSNPIGAVMNRTGLAAALLDRALVDPARLIDLDRLRALTSGTGRVFHDRARMRIEDDPQRLEYWCEVEPSSVVPVCMGLMQREPLDTLGRLARGIAVAVSLGSTHPPPIDVAAMAQRLCDRRRREGAGDDPILTAACWKYARHLEGAAGQVLAEDHQELSEAAFAALGKMRALFQGDRTAERFADAHPHLHEAMFFVLRTQPSKSIWGVLRRLLLALRALPGIGMPSDLRTWNEAKMEPPPEPWGWVPAHIALLFELFLTRELASERERAPEREPDLKELRIELARFCLDRLGTREPGKPDLIERDPHWRVGYILAARELHAALGGRGHRVLVWTKNNDPEPRVREAAALAEDVVRREQALPSNKSPRRAIFAAFWWLRQAHVLALGGDVDAIGARETFQKEVRRQERT